MTDLTESSLLSVLTDIKRIADESGARISLKPTKLMLGEAWLSQFDTPQEAYDAAVNIMRSTGYDRPLLLRPRQRYMVRARA